MNFFPEKISQLLLYHLPVSAQTPEHIMNFYCRTRPCIRCMFRRVGQGSKNIRYQFFSTLTVICFQIDQLDFFHESHNQHFLTSRKSFVIEVPQFGKRVFETGINCPEEDCTNILPNWLSNMKFFEISCWFSSGNVSVEFCHLVQRRSLSHILLLVNYSTKYIYRKQQELSLRIINLHIQTNASSQLFSIIFLPMCQLGVSYL